MCYLCYSSPFPTSDAKKLKKLELIDRAKRLKQEIVSYEALIKEAIDSGNNPCRMSVLRLEKFKAEQYELAKRF